MVMTEFDRAQQRHDADTEPPEVCDHEQFMISGAPPRYDIGEDIDVFCVSCRQSGTIRCPEVDWS